MIDKELTYAVVGASNNPEKYGHKVLKDLLDGGYRVIPINPKGGEILGLKVYPSIASVPGKIDWLVFVTQPEISVQLLPEAIQAGIKNVWLQPGSESSPAIKFCQENNLNCLHNACIMIARKN